MAKIGTIAWHREQIRIKTSVNKRRREKREERREQEVETGDYTLKQPAKKPLARYRSRVEYDFLKYIRVVFKWALDNSGLQRRQIELMLYLYSLGAFSKNQFSMYHKLIGMYQDKTLLKFQDDGWVKLWRKRVGRQPALYVLTHKGKMLCSKMHKFSCGVDDIPENPLTNKMLRKEAPRINNYYLDMIKKMNKDKQKNK